MKVDAGEIIEASAAMQRHVHKLRHAAAKAIARGEVAAADLLDMEANGVDWCVRRLRQAMTKRPVRKGTQCQTT